MDDFPFSFSHGARSIASGCLRICSCFILSANFFWETGRLVLPAALRFSAIIFFHLGEFGLGFFLGDVAAFDGAFDAFFDVLEVALSLGLIAFLAALLSDCGQGQKGESCQGKG